MRSITRFVLGAFVALPLTLAGASLAAADDYQSANNSAGPTGTSSMVVFAGVDEDGNVFYYQKEVTTGPTGATSEGTAAMAGRGGDPGGDDDGEHGHGGGSSFYQWMSSAGPTGATSSGVAAHAG